MDIDTEVQAAPRAIALWTSSIRTWNPPHEHDAVTQSDRGRIVANIARAFDANGDILQVIDDGA